MLGVSEVQYFIINGHRFMCQLPALQHFSCCLDYAGKHIRSHTTRGGLTDYLTNDTALAIAYVSAAREGT